MVSIDKIEVNTFVPEHPIFKVCYDQPAFVAPCQTKAHAYSDSDEEEGIFFEIWGNKRCR